VSACTNPALREPPIDPDVARAEIAKHLPRKSRQPRGMGCRYLRCVRSAVDPPTTENICAVVAVTEQESTFQVNPPVPGLPAIARREIDTVQRATTFLQ
jgi:hypothetical protein